DHTDEVMRRCEEISTKLYGQLGASKLDPTGGPVRVAETYQQVDQAQLIEACGDTARYLKPYQLVGINFLMLLYRQRIGGAILADEMGLGKTAQVISYLGAIRSLDGDAGPHLVIVTASLLENWQREFARWCPGMRVVPYYGKHRKIVRARLNTLRERMARGEEVDDDLSDLTDPIALEETARSEKAAADEAAPFDVMLTCYTLFERDGPAQRHDRPFLESWQWSHLIMDEAHALKNAETVRSRRLSRQGLGPGVVALGGDQIVLEPTWKALPFPS
ncbi:ATP-dependent helicase fft2, partial [Auxenochlorella protothecoides]